MARAIRRFRSALGDTQQNFAARAQLSVTSVARYETGWHPNDQVLARFVEIARREELPVFAAIFEHTLPSKSDVLLPDELPALQHLIRKELAEDEPPTPANVRRLRAALACLRLPEKKLSTIEGALGADLHTRDQLVEEEAGKIVIARDAKDEAKYTDFLRSPDEKSAAAYLRSLHRHTFPTASRRADAAVDRFQEILANEGPEAARLFLETERAVFGRLFTVTARELQKLLRT